MFTDDKIEIDYSKLHETDLRSIARNPRQITEQNLPKLISEIKKRNLEASLLEWIEFDTKTFNEFELNELVDKVKNSCCTRCNTNTGCNGYEFVVVASYLFFITRQTKRKILCNECFKRVLRRCFLITISAGWWSSKGLVLTPIAIFSLIRLHRNSIKQSDQIIVDFINQNTGHIRQGIHELIKIVKNYNRVEPDDMIY